MFFCGLELLCFPYFFRIIVSYIFRIFLYFLKIVHLEAVDSPRTLQCLYIRTRFYMMLHGST